MENGKAAILKFHFAFFIIHFAITISFSFERSVVRAESITVRLLANQNV